MVNKNVIIGAVAAVVVGLIFSFGIVIWSKLSCKCPVQNEYHCTLQHSNTSTNFKLEIEVVPCLGPFNLTLQHSNTSTFKHEVEVVPCLGPFELPKAPHWNAPRRSIYFVDSFQSVVHRFDPTTKIHKMAKVGNEAIAFIIPLKDTINKFIISYGPFLAILTWDGDSETATYRAIIAIGYDGYRANEGKVAPSGSLFVGTHSPLLPKGGVRNEAAGLYAFHSDLRTSKKVLDKVTISNGMGWSKDAKWFYFIDSMAYTVDLFSYNITNDELTNRKVIIDFRKAGIAGVPDGMVVDNEDKLWVTLFNGHQVVRIDPMRCEIMEQISLDALRITSAVFAGPHLSDFYILSGDYQNTPEETAKYPHSGYIYELKDFKVSGRPAVDFEIHPSFLVD